MNVVRTTAASSLKAPQVARQMAKRLRCLYRGLLVVPAAALTFATLTAVVLAQEAVGSVSVVGGTVRGTIATAVRELAPGDSVFEGETILTGAESAVVIVFLDASEVTLGPDSKLVLETLVFDPGQAKVVVTLKEGTMKFDSGNLPDEAYEVRTPTATVAVDTQ